MGFTRYNANPINNLVGDCVIRAISTLMDQSWDDTYFGVVSEGFLLKNMPSDNSVWGRYLRRNGYERTMIPDTCPDCYTIRDFCYDHPNGKYLLATGTHVVAVIDGDYYDTWDSGNEIPIYYWRKRRIQ